MARPLRIEYPDAYYHVMNRGRRAEAIFLDVEDYVNFQELLIELTTVYGIRIIAYCLMPNHYHLFLQTPKANLSESFRHLNGVYTQKFNRKHQVDGALFRGRFKSILVDKETYYLELIRYIHRNPLRAGIEKKLGDYPWSSHSAYLSEAKQWQWIFKQESLGRFGTSRAHQKRSYLAFVSQSDSPEILTQLSRKKWSLTLGNEAFKEWVREKFGQHSLHPEKPESRELLPTVERIQQGVLEYYQGKPEELVSHFRGQTSLIRDMALYTARQLSQHSLKEIGNSFGIENPKTVGSAIHRMKGLLKEDYKLRKDYQKIAKQLYSLKLKKT